MIYLAGEEVEPIAGPAIAQADPEESPLHALINIYQPKELYSDALCPQGVG